MIKRNVILASGSSARARILRILEIDFKQVPSNANEDLDKLLYQGRPRDYCDATCMLKVDIVPREKDVLYIFADTVVICNGEILEKPKDVADAKRMLMLYDQHKIAEIYTSMCLGFNDQIRKIGQSTFLYFADFTESEIDEHLSNHYNDISCNSGSLAIFESSARWVKEIHGCHYNCLGLSPATLFKLIKEINLQ